MAVFLSILGLPSLCFLTILQELPRNLFFVVLVASLLPVGGKSLGDMD
jgi:hypothetical protein